MSKFVIRPRRYHDQCDAIEDKIESYIEKGGTVDCGRNPNGKMELLYWAMNEIRRLRKIVGIVPPHRKTRLVTGPRVAGESKPVKIEEEE